MWTFWKFTRETVLYSRGMFRLCVCTCVDANRSTSTTNSWKQYCNRKHNRPVRTGLSTQCKIQGKSSIGRLWHKSHKQNQWITLNTSCRPSQWTGWGIHWLYNNNGDFSDDPVESRRWQQCKHIVLCYRGKQHTGRLLQNCTNKYGFHIFPIRCDAWLSRSMDCWFMLNSCRTDPRFPSGGRWQPLTRALFGENVCQNISVWLGVGRLALAVLQLNPPMSCVNPVYHAKSITCFLLQMYRLNQTLEI